MNFFDNCFDEASIKARFRELCKLHHPDLGGSEETMKQVNLEYEERLRGEFRKSMDNDKAEDFVNLEREVAAIDEELEKLHKRILNLLSIRKKKDHDVRVLRTNFYGELPEDKEWQTTLARLLREEGVKHLG